MNSLPDVSTKQREVFGSIVNDVCPKCSQISLPKLTGRYVNAVMCQNPDCKFILSLQDGVFVLQY
jgi:hypothetical protein